jgi:Flp pilus assembly protein TadD
VDMSIRPCHALENITLKAVPGTKVPGGDGPTTSTVDARVAAIPPESKREFETGQKKVNNNDFTAAIPHFEKAISLYPKYAEAYQLLGVAQMQTNQIPQAESSLVKALEIEDRMPRVQYLLGMLYARTNRVDLAERPFTRFADLEPQNPEASFELARVYFAMKRFAEAEMHARKAIELRAADVGVYTVLGYSLLRQSKPKAARQAFQQAVLLDPDSRVAADLKVVIAQIDEHSKGR